LCQYTEYLSYHFCKCNVVYCSTCLHTGIFAVNCCMLTAFRKSEKGALFWRMKHNIYTNCTTNFDEIGISRLGCSRCIF
jgi:hypothetical protein